MGNEGNLSSSRWNTADHNRSIYTATQAISQRPSSWNSIQVRSFESESDYHDVAEDTLETLMDEVEAALEACQSTAIDLEESEITLASGVLTIAIPPHGTWVLNKQTPNRQIWWSSPLSGPKRYEYDEKDGVWFSTKDGLSLLPLLSQELSHITGKAIDLKLE